MPLEFTATDEAVQARLSGEEGLVWLAATNYSLRAETRADGARLIDELVRHLDPDFRSKDKWIAWYDVLTELIESNPAYMKQLRTNLLFDFVFMMMRSVEDLVIVLKGLDPDATTTEARKALHQDGSLGELAKFANRDLAWYHRVLRLPKMTALPPEQRRALGRLCLSVCREAQHIVKDANELASNHKYWMAYNSIKHGGQALPEALGATGPNLPEWYPRIAPFGLVFYNWKDPVDTALQIPLGPDARRRYIEVTSNVRLTIQLLLHQYQHSTPLGRQSCLPPTAFILDSTGFVAADQSAVQGLYNALATQPLHVDARPSPPTFNTGPVRQWIAKIPTFPAMTDEDAMTFMQGVSGPVAAKNVA